MKNKLGIFLVILSLLFTNTPTAIPSAEESLSLANLAIPEALGKVESRFSGDGTRWIIHIQDVHAHFAAQENIAAIVDHLNAVYGIKIVALEGGWDSTDFPKSHGLPSSREKQMLARGLLEEDYITGPAYAALFSQTPLLLAGIEDSDLYEQNRALYLKHLANQEETLQKLNVLGEKIEAEKKTVFSPAGLGFDQALLKFRRGEKAEGFIPLLLGDCQKNKIELSDLKQIRLFIQILTLEQTLDKAKLQAEAERLIANRPKTRLSFEELLRNGKIPAEDLAYYPATQVYLQILKLQDQIQYRAFFSEIESAIVRLKTALLPTDAQKALDAKSERFLLAEKILSFEATPEDITSYEKDPAALQSEMDNAGLQEALALALKFYEIAKNRDDIFYQKITTDPKLSGNIAIVTGGFHTQGLSRQLVDAKISHIVISPNLGGEATNGQLYGERLRENITGGQTLSEMQNRFLIPSFDEAFAASVTVLAKTRNITQAVQSVVGANIQPSANQSSVSSPSVAGELQATSQKMDDFMALPRAEQLTQANAWLQSETPVTIVTRASTLENFAKTESGQAALEIVGSNEANTLGIILDGPEIPGRLNEGIAHVNRILRQTETGPINYEVLVRQRFKHDRLLAIIADDYTSSKILVLPASEISSLLIARLALESGMDPSKNSAFQALLTSLVQEILQTRLTSQAA